MFSLKTLSFVQSCQNSNRFFLFFFTFFFRAVLDRKAEDPCDSGTFEFIA